MSKLQRDALRDTTDDPFAIRTQDTPCIIVPEPQARGCFAIYKYDSYSAGRCNLI